MHRDLSRLTRRLLVSTKITRELLVRNWFTLILLQFWFLQEIYFWCCIELNEIRDLVEYLGHEVTDERLKEIFEKFDVDKSGGLDKDEVRKMVKELKPDYYKKITESNPHSLYA